MPLKIVAQPIHPKTSDEDPLRGENCLLRSCPAVGLHYASKRVRSRLSKGNLGLTVGIWSKSTLGAPPPSCHGVAAFPDSNWAAAKNKSDNVFDVHKAN